MQREKDKRLIILGVGVGTYLISQNNWAYTIIATGLAWWFLEPKDLNTLKSQNIEQIGQYQRPLGWPHPTKEHWHAPRGQFSRRVPNFYS